MDRLIEVDTRALTATAEAGVYGPALEKALQSKSLTLATFRSPSSSPRSAGWIAHRGAGQSSSGYGRVEGLAAGRQARHAARTPGDEAVPRLVFGAQSDRARHRFGRCLRCRHGSVHSRSPAPQASEYRGYLFHDFERGTEAIRKAVQGDVPVTMLRLSDAEETRFYRAFSGIGKEPGLGNRLAAMYLDARKFDGNSCALIAGFEGRTMRPSPAGREQFAAIAKSAGALSLGEGQGAPLARGDVSTGPICATR